jgi:hypothetical protein
MDIRAGREFLTSRGRVSAFLEIRNCYNRENIREYIYDFLGQQNGNYIVRKTGHESWLPLIPSFGIIWDF